MGIFLNSSVSHATYKELLTDPYFVDKSDLINELIPILGKRNRYLCITRPRRFGKTVMASMVASFFGKVSEDPLFDNLAIAESQVYTAHMHQYPVIYIDFSRIPENCSSYLSYIYVLSMD